MACVIRHKFRIGGRRRDPMIVRATAVVSGYDVMILRRAWSRIGIDKKVPL